MNTILPNNWKLIDFLKLTYIKGLTSSLIKNIIEKYNNFDEFINSNLPTNINLIINQGELFLSNKHLPEIEAEKLLNSLDKNKTQISTIWDSNYPSLLKEIHQPPILLFFNGTLKNLNEKFVSIVGTRKNSTYGKIQTERFTKYFSDREIGIVSGLAYGIDTIAHQTSISNNGYTIAVIASGIDKLGPNIAVKNADKILENGGCILTNFRNGQRALPPFFLQRNRIISGISKATIIVESKIKGGSLNTARFARDQNREVFAIPGNISSENSEGTNNLIKMELAKIAVSPESVFAELNYDYKNNLSIIDLPALKITNPDDKLIYDIISYEPIHIDDITLKSNFDIPQVLVILLNLEFAGAIKQIPGKFFIRT